MSFFPAGREVTVHQWLCGNRVKEFFSQSAPSVERLSKTYMTLSHISCWYLWLCQTFSEKKCLLGSVSHIAGAHSFSRFDTSALSPPRLSFALSFMLHCLTLKSVFFYRRRRRCQEIFDDLARMLGLDAVEESIEWRRTCSVRM